jgi:D-aminoacyl-tRNA deacylase
MRILLQRVSEARVEVGGEIVGAIGGRGKPPGLVALVGVGVEDTGAEVEPLARKVAQLRVFADDAGKMNRSVLEVGGEVLAVSQFTLYADCRKGRRPSFVEAAAPEKGRELFERWVEALRRTGVRVETGRFGAMMEVHLVNDGPVTIWLDSAGIVGGSRPGSESID